MTTMMQARPGRDVADALDALVRLYGAWYDEWACAAGRLLEAQPLRVPMPQAPKSCCELPPPCWMPREIDELTSAACPGSTATVRIRVRNRGPEARSMTASPGSDDAGVTISNSPLWLGPMEEGTFVVSVVVDPERAVGDARRLLIWVRGCREHYLRWNVIASRRSSCDCATVDVEDGDDGIHRWSDHFYCRHECRHG